MEARKAEIYKQAIEMAEKKKCFFIEHLVSFLPISMSTCYKYFPAASEEMEAIKDVINKNRVEVKTSMYNKWFKSENATLQIALMKLIATDEEAHRLNGTRQQMDLTSTDGSMSPTSPKTLADWYDANRSKKD